MVTVAIDLGSQNSVVSIYKNGNVETIPDPASGLKTVSSYVSFNDEGDRIVGNEAKNLAFMYPKSTLYDCKRLMGKSFSDPAIQEIKSKYPFDIVSDKSDRVMVVQLLLSIQKISCTNRISILIIRRHAKYTR